MEILTSLSYKEIFCFNFFLNSYYLKIKIKALKKCKCFLMQREQRLTHKPSQTTFFTLCSSLLYKSVNLFQRKFRLSSWRLFNFTISQFYLKLLLLSPKSTNFLKSFCLFILLKQFQKNLDLKLRILAKD